MMGVSWQKYKCYNAKEIPPKGSDALWNFALNAVPDLNQRNLKVVKKQRLFLLAQNAATRNQKHPTKWSLK